MDTRHIAIAAQQSDQQERGPGGIKDCNHYFSSSCPRVGCLSASPPEMTTTEFGQRLRQGRINTSKRQPTKKGPNHIKTYSTPDLHPIRPAAVLEGSANAESSSDGRPLLNMPDADKYVMVKHRHMSYDQNYRVRVSMTETPVLITDLRPVEQNIAYEYLLENASGEKVEEYYCLHGDRLRAMQDEILTCGREIRGLMVMSEVLGRREQGGSRNMMRQREREKRVYERYMKMDEKRRMLVSCERGVKRLLLKCQALLDKRGLYD